jgi:hypothetical protein
MRSAEGGAGSSEILRVRVPDVVEVVPVPVPEPVSVPLPELVAVAVMAETVQTPEGVKETLVPTTTGSAVQDTAE